MDATRSETQRIKLLIDGTGRALCDSSQMEKLAGTKMRIPDSEWAYEVIDGFAACQLDANWKRRR